MKVSTSKPKSLQVAELIKMELSAGRLRPGERLESSRLLAKRLNVGRQVLRSAMDILESEKIVSLVHGRGAFINEDLKEDVFCSRRLSVGFVMWNTGFDNSFSLRTYQILVNKAQDNNCNISVYSSNDFETFTRWLANYRIDGFILAGNINSELVERFEKLEIPFMLLGNFDFDNKVNRLEKDVYGILRKAFSYLIRKHGFTGTAMLCGKRVLGTMQAIQGVRDAAEECSVSFSESAVCFLDDVNAYDGMSHLLDDCGVSEKDIVYLSHETFNGAARCVLERNLPPEKSPFFCLDMSMDCGVPYPDLVGCFLYQKDYFAESALECFLDIYYGRVKRPWRSYADCPLNLN